MRLYAISSFVAAAAAQAQPANPLPFNGWYADPEIRQYDSVFWIFPTTSIVFEDQKWFDAFSSPDLINWTKHPNILTTADISWAQDSMWAPTSIHGPDGRYYFYFSANGLRSQDSTAGLGVAVADAPEVSRLCLCIPMPLLDRDVRSNGGGVSTPMQVYFSTGLNVTDDNRHIGALRGRTGPTAP